MLTVVVAVRELFVESGSVVSEVVVAVLVIMVPFGVLGSTCTTMVTVRTEAGSGVGGVRPPQVQVTVPVKPGEGVTHEPPALGVADTNTVLAGRGSTIFTFSALDGPLLTTDNVYVRLVPATTGSGVSVLDKNCRSASPITRVSSSVKLFDMAGSGVLDVTLALLISCPLVSESTLTVMVMGSVVRPADRLPTGVPPCQSHEMIPLL